MRSSRKRTLATRAQAAAGKIGMRQTLRLLYGLMQPAEQRRARALLALMVAVAVLEAVGVVSVMPFMALVANPQVVQTNPLLASVYLHLGFHDSRGFLIFAGAVTLVLLVASNAAGLLLVRNMYRFVYLEEHLLSERLMARYATRPYAFFLSRNSAELVKNTLSDVTSVVHGLLIPVLQVASKGLVALFLAGLLLVANPLLALVVAAVLGGAYALVYQRVHGFLGRLGRVTNGANAVRFTTASSLLGGIKEIKLYDRAAHFLAAFAGASATHAHHSGTYQIVAQVPRYLLEVLAMGGIVVILLYLIATGGPLDQSLPVVALYVLAGYRLMPALQQIFAGLASIRFNQPLVKALADDMGGAVTDAVRQDERLPALERSIELRSLVFTYAGAADRAVRLDNLTIPARASVAFVGPTGAGKSTIVDLILGLLTPDSGSILVDGQAIHAGNLRAWQKQVGYVPQQIYLLDDSITRNIAFGIADADIDPAQVERAARAARLHDFVAGELPEGYATVVGERGVRLSGGERQRIGIARALYRDPSILVFDEATAALDTSTEAAVMQAIESLSGSKTIIIIAHRLATVRRCQTIFLVENGTVSASGSYEQLVQANRRFRTMVEDMERA